MPDREQLIEIDPDVVTMPRGQVAELWVSLRLDIDGQLAKDPPCPLIGEQRLFCRVVETLF